MKPFFYEDNFCTDIGALAILLDIDKDSLPYIKEDWQAEVELTNLEPIFTTSAEDLCQLLADSNEDRLSEDFDDEEEDILKALKEAIDFEKLNSLLPKLYYANGNFETITKTDLINYFSE